MKLRWLRLAILVVAIPALTLVLFFVGFGVARYRTAERLRACGWQLTSGLTPSIDSSIRHWLQIAPIRAVFVRRSGSMLPDRRECVQAVFDLPNITHLLIKDCPEADDSWFQDLGQLKRLQVLCLSHKRITSKTVELLNVSEITAVELGKTSIDDVSLFHLAKCHKLRSLFVGHTNVTDNGIRRIPTTNLIWLGLRSTRVTDLSAETIAKCSQLQLLDLGNTAIGDAFFERAPSWKYLKSLKLDSTMVSDAIVPWIKTLPSLTRLSISGSRISPSGVERIQESLPRCLIIQERELRALNPPTSTDESDR